MNRSSPCPNHRFDKHLTESLGYATPQLLMDLVMSSLKSSLTNPVRFDKALDLGCGTGLSGEAIRPFVKGG